ncbi:AimR family lysis-lysogeny pheromone receptor [Thalassobacillus sp. B23F22_16]|uniref:AimR family lysis-lysogeny pheromone receptor n=1 Tax=Thalassobacillus sp. B23F22_16 TaxID=3459513 RepID=UPI00373E5FBE
MEDYQVIEPSRVDQWKMTVPSSIYITYHHLLKDHSREKATEMTKNFCMQHKLTQKETVIALEFLYMNGYFDEVRTILAKGEVESPYNFFYTLLKNRKSGSKIKLSEARKLRSIKQEDAAAEALRLFLLVYHYYDSKKYGILDNYVDDIHFVMNQINKPLLKYYYQLRFDELMFQHYWKVNMGVIAKKYAYRVINATLSPEKKSGMYHHLALTDVFDDYHSSMNHLQTSITLAKKYGLTNSLYELKEQSLPFIAAFHRKTDGVTTRDLVETAHLAIARNHRKQADEILSSLTSLTPFQETYLGVARNDRLLLHKAYQRFKNEYGDHFFARLPFYYLKYIK